VKAYRSVARERGVTTIPAALREKAAVRPNTELTWIEVEPQVWLVGPRTRQIERAAPAVAAALAEPSPFPKLMRRLAAGEIPQRPETTPRAYKRTTAPLLTEEQMIALGAPAGPPPSYRRGGD